MTCTITNDDQPGTLTVIKHVINDNGGDADRGQFTMNVDGTNVAPSDTFAGAESPGTTVTLNAGPYSGDRDGSDAVTPRRSRRAARASIANGESKTCTITNDDQPVTLHVIKHVVNDNGGDRTASDFTMSVDGTNVAPSDTFAGAECRARRSR